MNYVPVEKGSFLQINREERFFCSLLVHGLLASSTLRSSFFQLVDDRTGVHLDAAQGATEIYSEVAWLRDHWRNLGNPDHYADSGLEERRWEQLSLLLQAVDVDPSNLQYESFLRTGGTSPKIVSPGRWPLAQLAMHNQGEQLARLKWAFNATPDFLFIASKGVVLVEAKVESGPGKKKYTASTPDGHIASFVYQQEKTQILLGELLPVVAPYLDGAGPIKFAWLSRDKVATELPVLKWSEVAEMVQAGSPELDDFSRQGLLKFAQRSAAGA